jgi:hypothetical protein
MDGIIAQEPSGAPAARSRDGRLTMVTRRPFFGPDLNRIAETIRRNQELERTDPSKQVDQIWTDPEGRILEGTLVDPASAQRLTRITQETFYAGSEARLAEERRIVREKMPSNTVYATDGTYEGWAYSITNEFNDTYELFLWYDPTSGRYEVSLISPRLAGHVNVHECHLYANGTICLREKDGYKKMERAYARSVLWTRGASCYRRGYGFQFSAE